MSAASNAVRQKKRDVANELEQLYPRVFGATRGENRDPALQKETSYAILTVAMDTAKRDRKKQLISGMNALEIPSGRTRTRSNAKRKSIEKVRPSLSPFKPKRLGSTGTTVSEPIYSQESGPVATNDLVLIFSVRWSVGMVYSPMAWKQLCPDDGVESGSPDLNSVHELLKEDGLPWEKGSYLILSPDGLPVRSDRCFNFILECCAQNGMRVTKWRITHPGRSWFHPDISVNTNFVLRCVGRGGGRRSHGVET